MTFLNLQVADLAEAARIKAEAAEHRTALILRAAQQGLKPAQIAVRVGCSARLAGETIQRARAAITPDTSEALDHAKAARLTEARQRAAESEA